MTYAEALQWKEKHENLVGSTDGKDFVVTELVIVPSDPKNQEIFLRNYLLSKNKEKTILPYLPGDVQVWAVDWRLLDKQGFSLYRVLAA